MALKDTVKTDDYVNVKPAWPHRIARWVTRGIAGLAVMISLTAAVALIVESLSVDQTIDGWAEVTAIGDADTEKLLAALDREDVTALLNDPFFAGDAWTEFESSVAADDRQELRSMRSRVGDDARLLFWPHLRGRLTELTSHMTLSLDSGDRARLYASAAYDAICSENNVEDVPQLFELGPDGLSDEVVAVAAAHCPS